MTGLAETLGTLTSRRWRARAYDERDFAALAVEALAAAEGLDGLVNAGGLLGAPVFPDPVEPCGLGAPEIALYRDGHVAVHVCFAAQLAPAFLRPPFAGALRVVAGRYLAAELELETTGHVQGGFELGAMRRRPPETLEPGDVRPIAAGSPVARALIALERDAALVVLRTDEHKLALSLRYLPPGVALAEGREDRVRRSLRELALHHARTRGMTAELRGFLAGADLRSVFGVLLAAAESELPLQTLLAARDWPPWVRPALDEARRVHGVSLRLRTTADPDNRRILGQEAFGGGG